MHLGVKNEIKIEEIEVENTRDTEPSWECACELQSRMNQCLPLHWIAIVERDGLSVLLLSRDSEKTTQRRLTVSFEGHVQCSVHRLQLSQQMCQDLLSGVNICPLTTATLDAFVCNALHVVENFRKYDICTGCTSENYKCFWNSDSPGYVDSNPYGEKRFSETFRSKRCQLLILPNKMRCMHCYNLSELLRRRMISHVGGLKANTPNVHLTEREKIQKIDSLRKLLDSKMKVIKKLKKKTG